MSSKKPQPERRDAVIKVEGISKCFRSYRKPIHRLWQNFLPRQKFHDEFWALKNIDLTVYKGETVGIVGHNGAGKSTLLQIITGILQETEGRCETKGRISALLELGAGFNPDFSGMENARLNASIMGLTREEFHKKLPDIVEFCGLGDFLHRPVKTYSSGMFVRLAFAVAINMDPDILIIDEALAVGDVRFQSKCFRRLDELKKSGVSILFVTHSVDSVITHCDRAIMLDNGKLSKTGSPKEVVQAYLEKMFASDNSTLQPKEVIAGNYDVDFDPTEDNCLAHSSYNVNEHRWGDARARICHFDILQNGRVSKGLVDVGDKLTVRFSVLFEQDIDDLIYGITLKTSGGTAIYGTNSRLLGGVSTTQKAGDLVQFEFKLTANLLGGDYFISLGVAQDHAVRDNIAIDRRYDMIHIFVNKTPDEFGTAALNGKMKLVEVKQA